MTEDAHIPEAPRRAPAEGTANSRQNYGNPDGRETPTAWPDLSAKHADWALSALTESKRTDLDSRDRERLSTEAHILATLSLRDKLDELTSTLAHVIGAAIETDAELSQTIKTATQAVVVELRKHQVKAVDTDEVDTDTDATEAA